MLIPLYFTIVTSLKSSDQLGGTGFELPTSIRLENFANAWTLANFPNALLISGIMTVSAVIFLILTPIDAPVGILSCLWAWNDFMLPLVVLSDPTTGTLPLVQYVLQRQFNTDYTTAFASYLMALAPLLLVYLFAQRWVISGVMRGSIK